MFKLTYALLIVFSSYISYSQKLEVHYKSYSVKEFTKEDLKNMDPRQRDMAQKMKNHINEMEYILKIDSLTSEFTTVYKLQSPTEKNLIAQVLNNQIFYNSSEKFIEKTNSFGTVVLIEGAPYDLEWEITQETKMILGYECYLATAAIKESNNAILNIEAWFAPSLPYSFGPKAFYGLPGLILETLQNKGIMLQADRITLDADVSITEPSGYKKVSRESHNKQRQEMHEMMMSRMKN